MRTAELRPLGVGEILDVSIKLYLKHAPTLIKIVAIFVIPITVISTLFQIALIPDGAFIEDGQLILPTPDSFNSFIAQSLALGLLSFLGTLLATGAAFKAVGDAYLGRDPSAGDSIRFIARKALSLVWISIWLILIIYIGFILLVIPGIYLLGSLLVTVPALVFENIKGRKALHRSRELTRDRWGPSFAVFFLGIFLLVFVVSALIGFLFEAAILGSAEGVPSYLVLQGLGGLIAALLTTPLQACIITVLYFDLRVRKEGFDLQLLAERIGTESLPVATPSPSERPPTVAPPTT